MHNELPSEVEFLGSSKNDLDVQSAMKHFLGKSADQAQAMFRDNFVSYQEDLMWMHAPAFHFYMRPAIKYLQSEDANGDSDAVRMFCAVLEWRVEHDQNSMIAIASTLIDAIHKILSRFDRFNCNPAIDGDVPTRYNTLAAQLAALQSEK